MPNLNHFIVRLSNLFDLLLEAHGHIVVRNERNVLISRTAIQTHYLSIFKFIKKAALKTLDYNILPRALLPSSRAESELSHNSRVEWSWKLHPWVQLELLEFRLGSLWFLCYTSCRKSRFLGKQPGLHLLILNFLCRGFCQILNCHYYFTWLAWGLMLVHLLSSHLLTQMGFQDLMLDQARVDL